MSDADPQWCERVASLSKPERQHPQIAVRAQSEAIGCTVGV
jgi:hypothetical protein